MKPFALVFASTPDLDALDQRLAVTPVSDLVSFNIGASFVLTGFADNRAMVHHVTSELGAQPVADWNEYGEQR
jgi:hypothetical protein